MIKILSIQRANVRILSLVVDMAMIAILDARETIFPMKAHMFGAILGDLLVTVQAKLRLRGSGKRRVALCTIVLEFFVSLYHRPRNDKAFDEILRKRRMRPEHQRPD